MVRVFALGYINRILKQYKDQKLTVLDKVLLKGFYLQDKKEIVEINPEGIVHGGMSASYVKR